MKKLFIILCILGFCFLAIAGGITDKHKAVIGQTVASGESPVEMAPGDGWQIVFVNGSFVIIIDSIDADDTISF